MVTVAKHRKRNRSLQQTFEKKRGEGGKEKEKRVRVVPMRGEIEKKRGKEP
jgi:hypothetical protein